MKVITGNITDYVESAYLVIPTNIGWRGDGRNVMGRGLALWAAYRYPELPAWYGDQCQKHGEKTPVMLWSFPGRISSIILFPVKPLNKAAPWLSWQSNADLGRIEQSAKELAALETTLYDEKPIMVPAVGCGNGRLLLKDVQPILERHLKSDRFILVKQPSDHRK